jgi:exodeoxyribonuclease VII large subunit
MLSEISQPSATKVYSVSELTAGVRRTLEGQFGNVCVEGEVSNHRLQASGHQYFTLKDAKSQVACVWFAGRSSGLRAVPLSDGMQVQLRGLLTVFEARGSYQINVQSVQAAGAGLLQAKFEALKRRLQEEGLFDRARKRPLPRYPAVVALVTSPTGSVVQDMLKVLGRRAPWVRVLVYPVRVQGQTAAAEIADGIRFVNEQSGRSLPKVDVLIVGRGGGSVEDLWSFNEEVVARAIFHSEIPLVSAVGHETDFTIADFVADQRAPTPSAAAEMVVPDGAALERQVQLQGDRMEASLQGQLRRWRQRLEFLEKSALFREPRARLAEAAQRLDAEADSLDRAVRDRLGALTRRLENLAASVRAHRPDQVLALRRQQTEAAAGRLERALVAALQQRGTQVEQMRQKLVLLSPEGTLERGYSITLATDGTLVRSASKAAVGDTLVTRLRDGRVESTVTAVQLQGGTGEA